MFGGHIMVKTMIAVFALPLVAKADIHVDLKPLKELVVPHQATSDFETTQIRAAVQTISATAHMNAAYAQPVIGDDAEVVHEKTDQQHLAELLANIDALSKKAGTAE
jgi:hypothetical protein